MGHDRQGVPRGCLPEGALGADGLLAEPAEKLSGVGDLGAGVAFALAVLAGDEGREVIGVVDHQIECPA